MDPVQTDMGTTIQGPPHSREAEEAVLGAVLVFSEVYYQIAPLLETEDFYIHRNAWIYESFENLQTQGVTIDYVTVTRELEAQGRLGEVGGQAYLTQLLTQTPSSLNAEHYANIIKNASIRRRMISAANEMAKLAYDEAKSLNTVLDEAEKHVFGLSEKRDKKEVQHIGTVLSGVYDRVELHSQQSGEIFGVPSGLTNLDRLLGGFQRSDLIIVAARPGIGKTGFMLSAAKNAAEKHGKHVAFFSLEMSNEQLVQRLIAQETEIDTQRMRTGKINDDEWPKFIRAIEKLGKTQIFLDDTPAITPLQLRTKCRRLHLEHGLDLVIVDYLQLMSGDTRTDNRVQEVSHISRSLKVLARELDVPVLAAAQLSRAVEQRSDKRPVLSDLRESGSLEQDSDIVMFIHRPDALDDDSERQNIAEMIVAKHRNGPTHGGLEMIFMNRTARFVDAAKDYVM